MSQALEHPSEHPRCGSVVDGVADAGWCPSRRVPEDRAGFEEPKNAAISEVPCSRVSVREGSGLDLDPQEELGAVGDASHIAMVTCGTDAEHAMDYQGGGPSVRGFGEARSQT